MKWLEKLNYYEILEIPVNASDIEIRQAYKEALSIYHEDSLVTYTLFTEKERSEILKQVEAAFNTLIDKELRADYDNMLVKSGKVDASDLSKQKQKKPIPIFPTRDQTVRDALFKRIIRRVKDKEVKEILEQILSKEVISGHDLKKLRKCIGVELEEIFEIARISVSILQSIEEDQTERLPSSIYLKNFLKIYAELLQIDPKRVVEGYLSGIQRAQ